MRSILKQSFDFAGQLGAMQLDPTAGVKLPKARRTNKKADDKVISIDVRTKVLQAAGEEPQMKAMLTTLMFTGLRIGELLALRWSDIDLSTSAINVEAAVVRRPKYNEQGERLAVKSEVAEPKTECSYRIIRISEQLVDVLCAWKAFLKDEKGGAWKIKPNAFVFASSRTRKAYTYSGFASTYRKFLARHNLLQYGLNLHSYRHTFATMLLENGINPKIVQSLLGHSNINTTLGICAHVVPEMYDSVAESLDDMYIHTVAGSYKPTGKTQKQRNL